MKKRKLEKYRQQFIDILKDRARRDVKRYLRPDRLVLPPRGKKEPVVLKFPRIHTPTIHYGPNFGGVGVGNGKIGDDLGSAYRDPEFGEGGSEGGRFLDLPFTEEEILDLILLELPNIEHKGRRIMIEGDARWKGMRLKGPESVLIRRGPHGLYRRALKRQIISGEYDTDMPKIVPTDKDKRYRSAKPHPTPHFNAVIGFIRDISGSVSDEEQEIISWFSYFVEALLRRMYDELEVVYIVHHTKAKEVESRERFLSAGGMGGTKISTGHKEFVRICNERYPSHEWNWYPIYMGDGMNWGEDDMDVIEALEKDILPFSSQYSYLEIDAHRHWYHKDIGEGFSKPGAFGKILAEVFSDFENVVYGELRDRNEAWDALKRFFGSEESEKAS